MKSNIQKAILQDFAEQKAIRQILNEIIVSYSSLCVHIINKADEKTSKNLAKYAIDKLETCIEFIKQCQSTKEELG